MKISTIRFIFGAVLILMGLAILAGLIAHAAISGFVEGFRYSR